MEGVDIQPTETEMSKWILIWILFFATGFAAGKVLQFLISN